MRILIYGLNAPPEPVGVGKFTGEMGRWLAARGHHVKIICAPPYYPTWRVSPGYSAWAYRAETVNGIEVLRCPIWVPRRVTGPKRVMHLGSFALSSFVPMLMQFRWHPDVIVAVEPPLFGAIPALLSARFNGAKTWLHIQDFEIDAAFELGLLTSPRLRRAAFSAEGFLMRRFQRISTISEKMLQRALIKTEGQGYCLLFPNWVDTQEIFPLDRPSEYRANLGIPDESIVLLYSGSMGEKQGLELILEAARRLETDTRYQFVMAGSGSAYERLRQQAEGLTNMRWLSLQPREKLNAFLNLPDIHLLPQKEDAADLVMPSKLTGMLASGRPIITTAQPGTQVATLVSETGIVVEPGNLDAFVSAIARLGRDEALRRRLGEAARSYAVSVLDRERVLKGFEDQLFEVTGAGRDSPVTTGPQ
jgi:colanic acid biosynthesis glycosyl transferase WcaI